MAITVCVSISVSDLSKPPERRSTAREILPDAPAESLRGTYKPLFSVFPSPSPRREKSALRRRENRLDGLCLGQRIDQLGVLIQERQVRVLQVVDLPLQVAGIAAHRVFLL